MTTSLNFHFYGGGLWPQIFNIKKGRFLKLIFTFKKGK